MAAAPLSTTLTAGIQQPHPLSTSDDPTCCAACSAPFQDLGQAIVSFCCGRGVCDSCFDVEDELKHCPQCNSPSSQTSKEIVACLKKHSKKGRPWAQANLAKLYYVGDEIRRSPSESLHWNRQAAKRGHPAAIAVLGGRFLFGAEGCPVDLRQSQKYFEAGLKASKKSFTHIYESCQKGLVEIAERHCGTKSFEKARMILLPLVEEGIGKAQSLLGDAILQDYEEGLPYRDHLDRFSSALFWYSSAAFAVERDAAALGNAEHSAMVCCETLQKYAQAKFWARFAKKTLRHPRLNSENRIARVQKLVSIQRKLRDLRDTCGGCGAEFEGKERKFCRACRAYCYCSRECQKIGRIARPRRS